MRKSVASLALIPLACTLTGCATNSASPAEQRVGVFDEFTIRGAGGTHDIESAAAHGANVIRTWSVGKDTQALLDRAHGLGLKVILGVWMPDPHDAEHYRIKGRYQVDYTTQHAVYAERMKSLLDQYDDHPALLMWGLGNEVEYSVSFLKTINMMSQVVHRHNPQRLTTHVSVNANQIELFAEHASDIDTYGANSYGDGSMRNVAGILEKKWGKKYFFSEYSYHGPWSVKKTATGYPLEFSPAEKVKRLQQACAVFSQFDNLVGGVFFIWGPHSVGTGTWFNGTLPKNPAEDPRGAPGYLTPYTDALNVCWTGTKVKNHAPVISQASINGKYGPDIVVEANEDLDVTVEASDPENDAIRYEYRVFATSKGSRGDLIGEHEDIDAQIRIRTPQNPGSYTVLVYAIDSEGKASSHQVPFQVN